MHYIQIVLDAFFSVKRLSEIRWLPPLPLRKVNDIENIFFINEQWKKYFYNYHYKLLSKDKQTVQNLNAVSNSGVSIVWTQPCS